MEDTNKEIVELADQITILEPIEKDVYDKITILSDTEKPEENPSPERVSQHIVGGEFASYQSYSFAVQTIDGKNILKPAETGGKSQPSAKKRVEEILDILEVPYRTDSRKTGVREPAFDPGAYWALIYENNGFTNIAMAGYSHLDRVNRYNATHLKLVFDNRAAANEFLQLSREDNKYIYPTIREYFHIPSKDGSHEVDLFDYFRKKLGCEDDKFTPFSLPTKTLVIGETEADGKTLKRIVFDSRKSNS